MGRYAFQTLVGGVAMRQSTLADRSCLVQQFQTMSNSQHKKPKLRLLAVVPVDEPPAHREGDWEVLRARRARDLGMPSKHVASGTTPLVRERLIDNRKFSAFIDHAIVDRPERPALAADWLLARRWRRWALYGLALVTLASVIAAVIRVMVH